MRRYEMNTLPRITLIDADEYNKRGMVSREGCEGSEGSEIRGTEFNAEGAEADLVTCRFQSTLVRTFAPFESIARQTLYSGIYCSG